MKRHNRYQIPTGTFAQLILAFLVFGGSLSQSLAATILVTKQVNSMETSLNNARASAFFTASPDNLIVLTNIVTTQTPGLVGANVGAGDAATSISTGSFTLVGDATSAGGWVDGNGIPAGITLTFNIQFTTTTPNAGSFLTTRGNSSTALGDGVGITQSAGTVGVLDPGEILEVSTITISGVSFSGTLAEAGLTFSPGTVANARWNRLRSNNFETTDGATVTVGADVWGFGTSGGTVAGNLAIPNNYNLVSSTFVTPGPMRIETQVGPWNLKGLGFQYEVTYDIIGAVVAPTWTGGAADNNWSSGANWTGGLAPTNGQQIKFGAALRQTNTNNVPNLELSLLTFTNGGFNLFGYALTNTYGISNLAGINNLNQGLIYTGSDPRIWNVAAGSQLGIGGAVISYGNGDFQVSGGGTVTVGNGGSISFDVNSANSNVRIGMVAGETVTVNVNSGGTIRIPDALTGTSANRLRLGAVDGATGVLNINSGGMVLVPDDAVNPTRSLVDLGQVSNAVAVLNLNAGGVLLAQRVEATSPYADATFNFNGGRLQAFKTSGSTTYFTDLDRVQVRAGGAQVETTNSVTFVVPLTEDAGSPGGGLTKLGPGTLLLPAGNTYTGPTVVSEGTLAVPLPLASSALTVQPNATLTLTVGGSSWTAGTATFDGNTSTLNLDFGATGPAWTPLVVGTLAVNGATVINVSGTFTTPGSYPLIDYTSRTGGGTFQLGARPAGIYATLVTNAGSSSIDLLVSAIAQDLFWTGNVNGDWDIGLTANWDFLSGGSGPTAYTENPSVGDYVTFFNGPVNSAITLKANVKPSLMTFLNSSTDYRIGGAGVGIYGSGQMLVQGGGVVTLTTSNSFSGGVSNSLGFVEIGHDSALGTGPVTLWPSMTGLATTGLRSDGASARTIANPIQFRSFATNEVNFKLGDATRNGKLTFAGPIDFSGRRNEIAFDSDVDFTGFMDNGAFSKTGPGKLTFKGTARFTTTDVLFAQGDVIVNGGVWTNNQYGTRLVALDGLATRLILTNNGVITIEGGGNNLRVAGDATGSIPQGNGTNEFIMYSGQLNLLGTGTGGYASIGNSASLSSFGRIALLGGTATLHGLRGLTNAGPTELILDGVTLRAATNAGFSLPNFIAGFTNAAIQAGGVVADISSGCTAYVVQNLQGTGGLVKNGQGTLLLNGNNAYSGATVVNGGVLAGTGVLSGPVTIGALGTLAPGESIGTLTLNNSLGLNGTVFIEVDKAAMTADRVTGLTGISYGGALVVSNISATPLAGGEVFQLFNVPGVKSGNFSSVTILPAGLTGTFEPATGQLTISSAPVPVVLNPPAVSGTDLILTGAGSPNGPYSLLTSTNLAAPLSSWTTNVAGTFNGLGFSSNAVPIGAGPQRFFRLKAP